MCRAILHVNIAPDLVSNSAPLTRGTSHTCRANVALMMALRTNLERNASLAQTLSHKVPLQYVAIEHDLRQSWIVALPTSDLIQKPPHVTMNSTIKYHQAFHTFC